MAWIKIPAENHPLFLDALPRDPRISTLKMFGGLAGMVNGHMFAGLFARSIIAKLSAEDQQAALALDGSAPFDPMDNGRQMMVTRTLYSDRFNQPVVVRTYYDRVSDVAQLNIYDTNREDTNVGGAAVGSFVIPNGTQVVGVLNNDLSTQNVSEGDRFTMTVRSPGQSTSWSSSHPKVASTRPARCRAIRSR